MGKYKHFIMGLLEQIMTPALWMSADEVYDRLNEMKTISEKKYVQLPTKQSLAQQNVQVLYSPYQGEKGER